MKISLDFGITITDCLSKDNEFLEHRSLMSKEDPSESLIKNIFKDINLKKEVDLIAVTGGKHKYLGENLDGIKIVHVNEVDSIGEGAMKLSDVDKSTPSIIVSAGSGTACILAKDGEYMHCSGTGVGGGTVLGLSKLLLGTTDPSKIETLANKGNANKVDLILEEVVSGPIGMMPPDTTAVNFGKISKTDNIFSKEDIAAAIVNLVGQTAARIATSVAFAYQATDIIVVGRTPTFSALKKSLGEAALLTGFTPHFPENGHYASALGALMVAENKKPC